MRFDFLDFSTLAAREVACREEVRLNRRLAPDVYLDVVPITQCSAGKFHFAGTGETVDWLVKMRRLPTHLCLDALHRQGELSAQHVTQLVSHLRSFYQGQPGLKASSGEYRNKYAQHVRANWHELHSSLAPLPRDIINRIHGFQLQLLLLEPELFAARVQQGCVVEGHGDLRPEHICFEDPPVIFDCIEFNSEFREIDVADELAFLAAECDFIGANWFGEKLLADYAQASGDHPPEALLAFYKTYRACVRAKVADLRATQTEMIEHDAATSEVLARLQAADRYCAAWVRPLILAIGGLSGTGKSTLAQAMAETLGMQLLRTDVIRKELFAGKASCGESDQDRYSETERARVYGELLRRAARLHCEGVSVVLDATFAEADQLRASEQIKTMPRAEFLAIKCVCSHEVALRRIEQRQQANQDASEADARVYEQQRTLFQPWSVEVPQVEVNTEVALEEQVGNVLEVLRSQIKTKLI